MHLAQDTMCIIEPADSISGGLLRAWALLWHSLEGPALVAKGDLGEMSPCGPVVTCSCYSWDIPGTCTELTSFIRPRDRPGRKRWPLRYMVPCENYTVDLQLPLDSLLQPVI